MTEGNHNKGRDGGASVLKPFCRTLELAEISSRLVDASCSAIFISSEMGLGATTLLREVAKSASLRAAVIQLQGTPSLATIPFGILAPYQRGSSAGFVESEIDAIRQILMVLAAQETELRARLGNDAELNRPLLIIDDADYLDRATAEVAVQLATAGKIKLVIAHGTGNEPAAPLPRLWESGLAERFRLQSLTREAGHKFCAAALGGQTELNTSWYFWSSAGGNPLLMWLVMADALAAGKLRRIGDCWVVDMRSLPAGHQLREVVHEQLRGLSPAAREALNLIALGESVAKVMVAKLLGSEAIGELLHRNLLQECDGEVQLINRVYSEVIRAMVPKARSRVLHSWLINELETESSAPEAKLHMVIWSLQNGLLVSAENLLSAAIFASKRYETSMTNSLADALIAAGSSGKANIIKARAKFNLGQYREAAGLLEFDAESAESISELLFGGLLRAATHSALGLPVAAIEADASALRLHAHRLARLDPQNAADIVWRAQERADVLDLMAYSRAGRYTEMTELIQNVLSHPPVATDYDHLCNRSIVLAMDSERLSALGFPVAARERVAAAFKITQAEDHNVYFLPEMIITRVQITSLIAGEWDQAEQFLQSLAVDVGRATLSFGGSVGAARGMSELRQGKSEKALEVLLQGVDALEQSDPQQLLGFCVSMAAVAAAQTSKNERARQLLRQYRVSSGMFLVVAHEEAFIAAAREYLDRDGTGIAELLKIADRGAEQGLLAVELNALSLMVEFEPTKVLPRLSSVAQKVEGPWAAGLGAYAEALQRRDAVMAVTAGEQLLKAQMYQHAGKIIRFADSLLDGTKQGHLSARIRNVRERVDAELGPDEDIVEWSAKVHRGTERNLTRRESEIALMAARGIPDKDIAHQLHVSVRTVEGHLYRAYSKLGITARNQLSTVAFD